MGQRIHEDLSHRLIHPRQLFRAFNELAKANLDHINAHTGGKFFDFVAQGYITQVAMTTGSIIAITPHTTGTGAATLNVSSLGTKPIRHKNRALVGGELVQDREALLVYDGTYFELVNHAGGWKAWTPTVTGEGSLAGSITSGYTNYQCRGSDTLIDMSITLTTSGSDDDTLIFTCPTTVVTNSLGWAGCCVVSSSTLAPLLGNALSSDSKIRATVIGSTWGTGANRQVYLRMRYIG